MPGIHTHRRGMMPQVGGPAATGDMVLPSSNSALSGSGGDQYSWLSCANGGWGSTAAQQDIFQQVCPAAGSIKNLLVRVDTAPGVGKSWTMTLLVNGVASALTCAISGTDTTGSDLVNSVAVVAGDLLLIKMVPASTPTDTRCQYCTTFSPSGGSFGVVLSGNNNALSQSNTEYLPLCTGSGDAISTTATDAVCVCPTAGTISHMYVALRADRPPGASKSRAFTLYKNGSSTALTVTISGAVATTGNDTSNSVAVAAGDTLYWESVPTGTPSSSPAKISVKWTPDVVGEAIWMVVCTDNPSSGLTTYNWAHGSTGGWKTDESLQSYLCGAATLKKLYAKVTTAPGVGKSRAFTARVSGSNTALTCTISDAATSANDTSNTASVASGNLISLSSVPSGTPTAPGVNQFSMVLVS